MERRANNIAHLASSTVWWMLTVDWSEQIERWMEEPRLSRQCAKRAARMKWAAEAVAGLSKGTAQ